MGLILQLKIGNSGGSRRFQPPEKWWHEPIVIPARPLGSGIQYAAGGTIFGLGWALTGACPGPLFAFIGNGVTVMSVAVVSALAGTWAYGWLRPRLPN
jgi:uncharacterized membrane protein YedE/YeeE